MRKISTDIVVTAYLETRVKLKVLAAAKGVTMRALLAGIVDREWDFWVQEGSPGHQEVPIGH